MIERVPALFDVEPLRAVSVPELAARDVAAVTVVLGSRQRVEDLDRDALVADDVAVRRRHGGGGAVLLRPGDCWVELWLPAGTHVALTDVRETAYLVGGWWRSALRRLGAATELHRGGVRDPEQGARACFAGLGPGELTLGGDKLVGVSQWRTRHGTLVSTVLCAEPPSDLAHYLAGDAREVAMLERSTSLRSALPTLEVASLLDALFAEASRDVGALSTPADRPA